MHTLILLRHGESQWNLENRFTGWVDVDLSTKGVEEAKSAGRLLKEEGFRFDIAYTSVLKRAIRTLWIALDEMDAMYTPVQHSWRLNERHYGALQGLNKSETAAKYGEKQVHLWRRSYDVRPPELDRSSPLYAGNDPRYRLLDPAEIPLAECLKDTVNRFLPFWHETVAPAVKGGKRVIIAAHGNSLRALVKYLDGISDEAITELNIPTGVPLVYRLDDALRPLDSRYLGDEAAVRDRMQAVANQGKAR